MESNFFLFAFCATSQVVFRVIYCSRAQFPIRFEEEAAELLKRQGKLISCLDANDVRRRRQRGCCRTGFGRCKIGKIFGANRFLRNSAAYTIDSSPARKHTWRPNYAFARTGPIFPHKIARAQLVPCKSMLTVARATAAAARFRSLNVRKTPVSARTFT